MKYANAKVSAFCERSPRLNVICRYSFSNSQNLFQTYQWWGRVNCDVILVIELATYLAVKYLITVYHILF